MIETLWCEKGKEKQKALNGESEVPNEHYSLYNRNGNKTAKCLAENAIPILQVLLNNKAFVITIPSFLVWFYIACSCI